jgi:hypothetical protein
MCKKFWPEKLKGRDHLGDKEIECEGVEWIQPAQNRVQLRALVNTVMSLRVP